ncbi:hypothetical protein Tco_0674672 [Tanacetum coccineum]
MLCRIRGCYTSSGSSNSSGSYTEVSTCTKAYLKSYETLKEHYAKLLSDYKKSQLNVASYKVGLELVEERLEVYKKNEAIFEEDIKILKIDVKLRDKVLAEHKKIFEKAKKESDDLKLTLEKFQNSSKNLGKLLDSQMDDKNKTSEGYHVVPPSYTGNFMPPKPELVLADTNKYVFSELVTSMSAVESDSDEEEESKSKVVKKTVESKNVKQENVSKSAKPSYAKIEFERPKSARHFRQDTYSSSRKARGNQRNWNNMVSQGLGSDYEMLNKTCFVYGS